MTDSSDRKPARFIDVDAEKFPLVITIFNAITDEVLWTQTLGDIGVLDIPGYGGDPPVRVRVVTADGEVHEHG